VCVYVCVCIDIDTDTDIDINIWIDRDWVEGWTLTLNPPNPNPFLFPQVIIADGEGNKNVVTQISTANLCIHNIYICIYIYLHAYLCIHMCMHMFVLSGDHRRRGGQRGCCDQNLRWKIYLCIYICLSLYININI